VTSATVAVCVLVIDTNNSSITWIMCTYMWPLWQIFIPFRNVIFESWNPCFG